MEILPNKLFKVLLKQTVIQRLNLSNKSTSTVESAHTPQIWKGVRRLGDELFSHIDYQACGWSNVLSAFPWTLLSLLAASQAPCTCTHPLFICTHAAILSTNIWSFQLTATVRQHLTSHSIKGPARLCSSLVSFFLSQFFCTGNLRLPFPNQRSALPCTAHSHSLYCDDKKWQANMEELSFCLLLHAPSSPAIPGQTQEGQGSDLAGLLTMTK